MSPLGDRDGIPALLQHASLWKAIPCPGHCGSRCRNCHHTNKHTENFAQNIKPVSAAPPSKAGLRFLCRCPRGISCSSLRVPVSPCESLQVPAACPPSDTFLLSSQTSPGQPGGAPSIRGNGYLVFLWVQPQAQPQPSCPLSGTWGVRPCPSILHADTEAPRG